MSVQWNRRGPFQVWPSGKYRGNLIDSTIREDPAFFMYEVKMWLDITPEQAELFYDVTGGGEIPPRFIKDSQKKEEEGEYKWPEYYTQEDIAVVKDMWHTIPNYDFDPDLAPEWWPECKARMEKEKRPSVRRKIYDGYLKRDLQEYVHSERN